MATGIRQAEQACCSRFLSHPRARLSRPLSLSRADKRRGLFPPVSSWCWTLSVIIQLPLTRSKSRARLHLPSKGDTDATHDTVCLALPCLLFSSLSLFATCTVRSTKDGKCDSILRGDSFLKMFKKDWKGVRDSEHTAASQAALQQGLQVASWKTWM